MTKTDFKTINFDKLTLSPLKTTANGNKVTYLNYEDKYLKVESPWLYAPFGASYYKQNYKQGDRKNYSLMASLKGNRGTLFKDFLKNLDKFIKENLLKNKEIQELFGDKLTKDGLDMMYSHIVKDTKENKYPQFMNVKFPHYNDVVSAHLFDTKGTELEVTPDTLEKCVPPKCHFKCLFHIASVYIINGKLGVSLKLLQGLVKPEAPLNVCQFQGVDKVEEKVDETVSEFDIQMESYKVVTQ